MKQHDLGNEKIISLFFSYAVPGMIAVCVFSLYSLVDAAFVSRACGPQALAAVGLCAPVITAFSFLSVVVGVGANVLIGISLGENNQRKAGAVFSLSTAITLILSIVFLICATVFTKPFAHLLGADEETLPYVCTYLSLCGWFAPFFLIGGLWGLSVETAGKPSLAMAGDVISTLANIVLDYLFIIVLDLGVFGASLASGISSALTVAVYALGLFGKDSALKFTKFSFDLRLIGSMLFNGFSEGMSAISTGIIAYVYNQVIMKNGGSNVLADYIIAITVISFVGSVLIGAASGITPIISFNIGSGKPDRVKQTLKIYIVMETILAGIATVILLLINAPVINLLKPDNPEASKTILFAYIPSLLFMPAGLMIISYFTALKDAKTSAVLSVLRTLVIRLVVVFFAFKFAGLTGVWWSCVISEAISLAVCFAVLKSKKTLPVINNDYHIDERECLD